MSLDDLESAVAAANGDLQDFGADLDRESRTELAMLVAALDTDDPEDLLRRAVHLLFQSTVDSGKLDFHLRSEYGVTYDEYLSGMTYEEMAGGGAPGAGSDDDTRRYQY
jgi:predicted Zn-dependent peptidase